MRIARRIEDDRFEMGDDIAMKTSAAPTNETEWLEFLTALLGDGQAAALAYQNVLLAIESDDELSVIWHDDEVAA